MSVSFSLSGTTVTVQNPDLNDRLDVDTRQVVQPKASGGFYRFSLSSGPDTQRLLKWTNLRKSELGALTIFFTSLANGALNEFTFTDERGVQWTAHFLNTTLDPETVSDDAASVSSFSSGGRAIPTTVRSGGWYALTIRLHLGSPLPATTPAPTAAPTTHA